MSTTPTTVNVSAQKATIAVLLAALHQGLSTGLAGVDTIEFDSVSHARTDLVARVQAILDAIAGVKAARTTLSQAVASQKAAIAQGRLLRSGLKRFLQAKYGPTSPKLQEFGFAPARTPKTPLKAKAEGKAKAAATRLARGTKGKKQKLAIKGTSTPSATAPTGPNAPATSAGATVGTTPHTA